MSQSVGGGATYVPYPIALRQLHQRLGAMPEELAAWVHSGPDDGGLAAYVHANELEAPPRFYFPTGDPVRPGADHDFLPLLMVAWFHEDDLARFTPADRYLTGHALIERWSVIPGIDASAYVRAKIAESRLVDTHPVYGGTRGTFPGQKDLPPLELGLFRVADVEAIEAEDLGTVRGALAAESADHRRLRLRARKTALEAQGVRRVLAQLAEEEGISQTRIKQLVYDSPEKPTARSPATWVTGIPGQGSPVLKRKKP